MKPTKAEIRKAKNLLNKYAPKGEELAYINSKEANLLKKMGGAGKDVNGTGIKSYYGSDDYGYGEDGKGSSTSSGNNNNGSSDREDHYMNYYTPSKKKSILDISPTFQLVKGAYNFVKGVIDKRNPRSRINDPQGLYAEGNFKQKSRVAPTYQSDNDNRQPATNVGGKIVKLSPSSAEISQSNAADVTYDSRKTKAKGRKMTILTNSRGIGINENAYLGQKSLLGRV